MSAIYPTSRPWQVKHDFDLEGRTTIIGNVDGEIIDGTTHHSFDFVCRTIDEADDNQSRSVAVANADFIVRAVNAHDALLSIVERFVALPSGAWHPERHAAEEAELMREAKAIVAKAEGGAQ